MEIQVTMEEAERMVKEIHLEVVRKAKGIKT